MDCFVEELPRAESEPYNKRPRQNCHGKWNRGIADEYVRTRLKIAHGKITTKGKWYAHLFEKKAFVLVKYDSVEEQFRKYADAWYEELNAEADSSLTNITSDSMNYLHVIGLSPKSQVITLILQELQSSSAPWFLALEILTGNSMVGKQYSGNFIKMAEEWVKWGFDSGYLYETTFSI
jgi:hypothetical protein